MTTDYIDYLRRAALSPGIRALKDRALALMNLSPGQAVLDLGCGPGLDTVIYATAVGPTGSVLGIDADPAMVTAAETAARGAGVSAWLTHRAGTADTLALADSSFDVVHAERLLQHVTEPVGARITLEASRVVRRGGLVIFADTDWASLSIDVSELELERRVTRAHLTLFGNAVAGRQLPRLLRSAGLIEIETEGFSLPLEGSTLSYLLGPTERWALQTGLLTTAEWWRWRSALAYLVAPNWGYAHVTVVLAAGRRP
jgi:ubiquinone/menaquinone biosynthesis C-methylase UbiE